MLGRTIYYADFNLFLLARPVVAVDGKQGWQVQEIHNNDHCGLAVYSSALDAEIMRANRIACGEAGWRRFSFDEFDITKLLGDGVDKIICQMVFGFVGANSRHPVIVDGRIQSMYFTVPFCGMSTPERPIIWNFAKSTFDGMRESWGKIGSEDYEQQLAWVNRQPALKLANAAQDALETARETSNGDCWGIYQPLLKTWRFGGGAHWRTGREQEP